MSLFLLIPLCIVGWIIAGWIAVVIFNRTHVSISEHRYALFGDGGEIFCGVAFGGFLLIGAIIYLLWSLLVRAVNRHYGNEHEWKRLFGVRPS
jgi:surface polysaccharide O-acyltransferase-like enzyme